MSGGPAAKEKLARWLPHEGARSEPDLPRVPLEELLAHPELAVGAPRVATLSRLQSEPSGRALELLAEMLRVGAPWAGLDVAAALGRRCRAGPSRWGTRALFAVQWEQAPEASLDAAQQRRASAVGELQRFRVAGPSALLRVVLPALPPVREREDLERPLLRLLAELPGGPRNAFWIAGVPVVLGLGREVYEQLLCAATEE